ncbi:MAG: FkbM family methyltransferase [bacterium]
MKKYLKASNYIDYAKNKLVTYTKSYSQSGEDLILNNFFKYKNTGVYIDIGANDPKKFNNTYFFYKKGWQGINIEPNIKKIALLNKYRRKDLNLNLGAGSERGVMNFYNFKPDTLSTFSEEIAKEYQSMGHTLKQIEKINVLPLKTILEKHLGNRKIDFLTIDTEGHDLDILKSNDWTKYRPTYIIVETLEYKSDDSAKKIDDVFSEYLTSIDYAKAIDTYINTIYYDKKNV